jgi:hypothetical protein
MRSRQPGHASRVPIPAAAFDVAHAHSGRADQREHQIEAGQGNSAEDGSGQEEPVPADRGSRDQEQRRADEFRACEHVGQPPDRGVDP